MIKTKIKKIKNWSIQENNGKMYVGGIINEEEVTYELRSINTDARIGKVVDENGDLILIELGNVNSEYTKFCRANNIDHNTIVFSKEEEYHEEDSNH